MYKNIIDKKHFVNGQKYILWNYWFNSDISGIFNEVRKAWAGAENVAKNVAGIL